MSLRRRIIVQILLSSLCVLALGGALTVRQARQEVEKEVDSSVQLALQLMNIVFSEGVGQNLDLSRFQTLQQTRHLSIQLQKADGQLVHAIGSKSVNRTATAPPDWFIRLVEGDYPKVEHRLKTHDGEELKLIIQAEPLDEITEVWQEDFSFFVTILLLTIVSFIAINLVFDKALKSIAIIVDALQAIEAGKYQQKLPSFALDEFDNIAKAINHMMTELDRAQRENRALAQHSLAIQEDERQRLSQELHDEFGQSLTAIKVMAVSAEQRSPEVHKMTASIAEICDHLMLVVRTMMQQLHPLVLTELGLKAALEEMVRHWEERNPGLGLRLDCVEDVDYVDKDISIQIFRVVQECLTNVIRHAQAHNVDIGLDLTDNGKAGLVLKVQDDGVGCDLQDLNQGFGLMGIRERIKSLGGEVDCLSQTGRGMLVKAWVPL